MCIRDRCNGLVVSYLKVQPFIATLGMQQVVYGICLVYTGGTPIGSLNSCLLYTSRCV